MKKLIGCLIILLASHHVFSQEVIKSDNIPELLEVFSEESPLPIKLTYAINYIKKNTNDTTYVNSNFSYQLKDGSWHDISMLLRARGNYRFKKCYFPPLKIKFKKEISKNTIFEGNKSLKIVFPCLQEKDKNDNVIKEYLAYKLFEIISPYYFRTRLTDITFEEEKTKNNKIHNLKGILIEDDKTVAKRMNGNVYDKFIHPLAQEPKAGVRNAFFQYMIGNTDFSQAYSHNVKLIFIDKKGIPIPYDFDMAGFVHASYSHEIRGGKAVGKRKYRGFKRDKVFFNEVRQEFIEHKDQIMLLFDTHKHLFESGKEFEEAKNYISNFYEILQDDRKYSEEILLKTREK